MNAIENEDYTDIIIYVNNFVVDKLSEGYEQDLDQIIIRITEEDIRKNVRIHVHDYDFYDRYFHCYAGFVLENFKAPRNEVERRLTTYSVPVHRYTLTVLPRGFNSIPVNIA